jgi:long-chain fatty acid transport protein
MPKTWLYVLIVCVAWLGQISAAHASPLLEMMGSFGDGGGQQGRNLASGASAAYFNPALLVDASTGVMLGGAVLGSRIAVGLSGRGDGSFDVPNGLANAEHADRSRFDNYPISTETLQLGREKTPAQAAISARPRQAAGSGKDTLMYGAVGLVVRFLDQRLALGFYGLLPMGDFMTLRSFYVDEREQYTTNSLHPELYGDRLTALAFGVGLGYRVTKRFSLGLGSGFIMNANAGSPGYVADAAHLDGLILNIDTKVKVGLAPYAGFAWRPLPRWRLTGTVHSPQELAINADVKFLIASGGEQTTALKLLFDWMPWQVGLGTSFDVVQRKSTVLTLGTSAVYARWSQYVDRHGDKPVAEFGWYDTITSALGARLAAGGWKLGLDVQYKPTPVPLQRGRSNYVDNDRLGASQSLEYTFPVRDTKFTLGVQLQGFWLLERSVRKLTPPTFADGRNRTPALVTDEVPDDARIGGKPFPNAEGLQTNNPGWPGFSSKGWLSSAGLYLSVTL